jgi:hypothetical protein
MGDGAFRELDPVIAARAFLGMVFDHLNVHAVFRQDPAPSQSIEEVVETFVSIFLRGIERRGAGDADA